jgi:subtilisin family serine protease
MKRTALALLSLGVLAACSDHTPTQVNDLPTPWPDPVAPTEPPPPEPAAWIVTFNELNDDPVEAATQIITETGGSLLATYRPAIRGFAAEIPDDAIATIRAMPDVASVQRDGVISISGFPTVTEDAGSWGLDRVDQRDLPLSDSYSYTSDGTGVTVYVMDTGIRATHVEFSDGAGGSRAWSSAETDFVSNDPRAGADCNGHGTHVAGTVGGNTYGVAKNVELVGVRVLECGGWGYYSWMLKAIDWIAARHEAGFGPSVVNMSIAGGFDHSLNQAIAGATAKGVVFAVAAGNQGRDACLNSPASAAEALTVAASMPTDVRPGFSNFGSCVDLFAPGTGILSAVSETDTALRLMGGTSMASPHVAGAAALLLGEDPWAGAGEVADAIKAAATPGRISEAQGSPNLLLYTFADAPPPAPSGADLRVALTESADPIRQDGQVVYTTTVTNVGPEAAIGSKVRQALPSTASVVAMEASQGSCALASGQVDCDLQSVASGGSVRVSVTVRPASSGLITTDVSGSSTTDDPDLSNNFASASTMVEAPPSPVAVVAVGSVSITTSGKFVTGNADVNLDAARGGVTVTGSWYKDGESSPFRTASAISNTNGVATLSTGKLRNAQYLNFCVTSLSGSSVDDSTTYPMCDPDFGTTPTDPGTGDPPSSAAPSNLMAVFTTNAGGRVELTWSPGPGGEVDVYRGFLDGSMEIIARSADNGRYNDRDGTTKGFYQVCVSGSTSACSEVVSVR